MKKVVGTLTARKDGHTRIREEIQGKPVIALNAKLEARIKELVQQGYVCSLALREVVKE